MEALAVADGTVFVDSNGFLLALSAVSGEERWRFHPEGYVYDVPAVSGSTVFFLSGSINTDDGYLYALDATNGEERWAVKIEPEHLLFSGSAPAVTGGLVLAGDQEGRLYAFDADSGSERCRFQASDVYRSSYYGLFTSAPSSVGGVVYFAIASEVTNDCFGPHASAVYALDVDTGAERWCVAAEGGVLGSPAVVDGVVYVGTTAGCVYAIGDP